MSEDGALWAASRDASWYDRPNVRSGKQIHVAGRLEPLGKGTMSRCGRSILDESLTWRLEDVPVAIRCHSHGCRQAWP